MLLIASYRTLGNTHMGGTCRFHPSCSQYAVEAIQNMPPWTACFYILVRLLKCRPWGPRGFDPIPQKYRRAF